MEMGRLVEVGLDDELGRPADHPELLATRSGRRMPVSQVMLARTAAPDLTETRTGGHLGKTAVVTTVST